ncbi:MAG: hypothetical protein LBR88_04275 [Zoogloeaceae bacterium]|jgi:hypothetical protein|nr:hypothetical protein [Zoogloeaceae bacterium]
MSAIFSCHLSRFLLSSAITFLLPIHNASACISEEVFFTTTSVHIPALIAIALFIFTIVLIAAAWGIKRIFFRRANNFTILAPVSIILAIILGLFATFAIPEFVSVFQSRGAELPMLTAFILRFRFLLWLPLLLTAISYRRLRLQTAHALLAVTSETILLLLVLMALYITIFKFGCIYV